MAEHRASVTFTIDAQATSSDMAALYRQVCAVARRSGTAVIDCNVHGAAADAATVDVIARAALAARRLGCQMRLIGASGELLALLELCGLTEVLSG